MKLTQLSREVHPVQSSSLRHCLIQTSAVLLTVLTFLTQSATAQQTGQKFKTFSAALAASGSGAAADWGDFDNDGDLDAVVSGGRYSNSYGRGKFNLDAGPIKVYRNDGEVFTDLGLQLRTLFGKVLWADIDADGRLDIIMVGTTKWTSASTEDVRFFGAYRQETPSSFTPVISSSFGEWIDSKPKSIPASLIRLTEIEKVADVNGDGLNDIVVEQKVTPSSPPGTYTGSLRVCFNDKGAQQLVPGYSPHDQVVGVHQEASPKSSLAPAPESRRTGSFSPSPSARLLSRNSNLPHPITPPCAIKDTSYPEAYTSLPLEPKRDSLSYPCNLSTR